MKFKTGMTMAAGFGVLALLFFFPPGEYRFYPRCLLYQMTGFQCAGCGGLRATHPLLHGLIAAALHLNPLFVILLPLAGVVAAAVIIVQLRGGDSTKWLRSPLWLWLFVGTI